MQTELKTFELPVLEQIQYIAKAFKPDNKENSDEELLELYGENLKQYLGLEIEEVAIFIAIFVCKYGCLFMEDDEDFDDLLIRDERNKCAFSDICLVLNRTAAELSQNLDLLDRLIEKNIIGITSNDELADIDPFNARYYVIPRVANSIFRNQPIENIKTVNSCIFVGRISTVFNKTYHSKYGKTIFYNYIKNLESRYSELPFVSQTTSEIKNFHNRTLFYLVCNNALEGINMPINLLLEGIHENSYERLRHWDSIFNGKNALISRNWLKYDRAKKILSLDDKGRTIFQDEFSHLLNDKKEEDESDNVIISPDNIIQKDLFYNTKEKDEIEELYHIFSEEKLSRLRKNLKDNKFHEGICIMLYGNPGTGKTETCLQLAKKSGRKIMQVDIASTRTKWYGESENLLKKVFSDYNELCKKEEILPILLFNEADAIFTNRDNHDSNETNHRLQNILLEEIEKLDGIMIATTNLQESFDRAFERRFLYKVKFSAPETSIRKKIWENRLHGYNESEYEYLASKYVMTGGEIENIVRKKIIRESIENAHPSFPEIIKLCNAEHLENDRSPVGFGK